MQNLIRDLPLKVRIALIKEIAQYGERAYRRGFQQGIALHINGYGVDEDFAAKLRHKNDRFIYEVYEGHKTSRIPAKLYKLDLLKRIQIEKIGPLISALISWKSFFVSINNQ